MKISAVILVAGFIVMTFAATAKAADRGLVDEPACKEFSLVITKAFSESRFLDVYKRLQEHAVDPNKQDPELSAANTAKQIDTVSPLLGEMLGLEYVGASKYGNVFLRITTVLKYKSNPLFVVCTFYRLNDAWQIKNFYFNWNTELDKILAVIDPELWSQTEIKRKGVDAP